MKKVVKGSTRKFKQSLAFILALLMFMTILPPAIVAAEGMSEPGNEIIIPGDDNNNNGGGDGITPGSGDDGTPPSDGTDNNGSGDNGDPSQSIDDDEGSVDTNIYDFFDFGQFSTSDTIYAMGRSPFARRRM